MSSFIESAEKFFGAMQLRREIKSMVDYDTNHGVPLYASYDGLVISSNYENPHLKESWITPAV